MADLTRADLAELRRLLAMATPGPWRIEYDGDRYEFNAGAAGIGEVYDTEGGREDAALIVALVNAAPRLIEMAERAARDDAFPATEWGVRNAD